MKDIKQIPIEHLIYALMEIWLAYNSTAYNSTSSQRNEYKLSELSKSFSLIRTELCDRPEIQASFKILGLEELYGR